jgi:hypothetical protein
MRAQFTLSSFTANRLLRIIRSHTNYPTLQHALQSASYYAHHPTSHNRGHVPAMPFLIAWAYEDSSRPCAQLTFQHIALPRNSLQALLPHHLHRPLLLQLRFPPLFAVLGHLDVFIHHRVYHRKGEGSLPGRRGWIASCPVCALSAPQSSTHGGRTWRCVGDATVSDHWHCRYGSLRGGRGDETVCETFVLVDI